MGDVDECDGGLGSNHHKDAAHRRAIRTRIGLNDRITTKTANLYRGVCLHVRPLVAVEDLWLKPIKTARGVQRPGKSLRGIVVSEVGRVALRPRGGIVSIALRLLQVKREQRPGVEAQVVVRVDHVEPVAVGVNRQPARQEDLIHGRIDPGLAQAAASPGQEKRAKRRKPEDRNAADGGSHREMSPVGQSHLPAFSL